MAVNSQGGNYKVGLIIWLACYLLWSQSVKRLLNMIWFQIYKDRKQSSLESVCVFVTQEDRTSCWHNGREKPTSVAFVIWRTWMSCQTVIFQISWQINESTYFTKSLKNNQAWYIKNKRGEGSLQTHANGERQGNAHAPPQWVRCTPFLKTNGLATKTKFLHIPKCDVHSCVSTCGFVFRCLWLFVCRFWKMKLGREKNIYIVISHISGLCVCVFEGGLLQSTDRPQSEMGSTIRSQKSASSAAKDV